MNRTEIEKHRDCFRREIQAAKATGHGVHAAIRLEQKLAENPDDGGLHQAVGLAFADLALLRRARPVLETAQVLTPLCAEAEVALADCYIAARSGEHAAGLLRNAGLRNDSPCALRLRAAERLGRLGGQRLGWMICRKAVQDFPDEPQAWFDLSYFLGRVGSPFPQIESAAMRAIDLAPDVVCYRTSLASALFQLDRAADAYRLVRHFESAQINGVACDCCVERLGLIFESADDWRLARLCLERRMTLRQSRSREATIESDRSSGGMA